MCKKMKKNGSKIDFIWGVVRVVCVCVFVRVFAIGAFLEWKSEGSLMRA